MASVPHTPRVSIANGTNRLAVERSMYFVLFLFSAATAAAPAAKEVWLTCDGASMSGQVKSHTKGRPLVQGVSVMPSGRFPSFLSNPVGSKIVGVLVLLNARAIASFARECRK